MRFADVVKCAANLVMPMGWKCTADFSVLNYPICSFSFSLLSKICDIRSSEMFSSWNRCDVLSFKQRCSRSLRNALIRGSAIPHVSLPRKDFNASWSLFRVFVEAYTLARPSFHSCIATFQTYGKLTTRSDFHRTVNWSHKSASRGHEIWHEVVLTHGSAMNGSNKSLAILSSQSNRLADATFSKSGEA